METQSAAFHRRRHNAVYGTGTGGVLKKLHIRIRNKIIHRSCIADFKQKSLSRINNTLKSSKRKSEELEEILQYFDGNELKMVKTALDKLKQF